MDSDKKDVVCVLCMKMFKDSDAFTLNSNAFDFPININDMIIYCIGIKIPLDDYYFPNHTCTDCGRLLISFYKYKQMCSKNYEKLITKRKDTDELVLKSELENDCKVNEPVDIVHDELMIKEEFNHDDEARNDTCMQEVHFEDEYSTEINIEHSAVLDQFDNSTDTEDENKFVKSEVEGDFQGLESNQALTGPNNAKMEKMFEEIISIKAEREETPDYLCIDPLSQVQITNSQKDEEEQSLSSNLPLDNSNDSKPSLRSNLPLQEKINDSESRIPESRPKKNRTRDHCFFCKKLVLNFSIHLQRHHASESEVKNIFSLSVNSKRRRDLICTLRKRGNYLLTEDQIKPIKKTNKPLLTCDGCLGYYAKNQLWRHKKRCKHITNRQSTDQHVYIKLLNIDEQLVNQVLLRMRMDEISEAAKRDTLICCFGAKYLQLHNEKEVIAVCSRKMRQLARLLLELKKCNSDIKNMFYALQLKYYDLIVTSTQNVAKFDREKGSYESPSFVASIATSLKQCCELAILHKEMSAQDEAELTALKNRFTTNWKFDICSLAVNGPNAYKLDKVTLITLASDLKLLKDYLILKANKAVASLKANGEDQKSFVILAETILCRLILINRKIPGELETLYLHSYKNIGKQSYEEFSNSLTPMETILIAKFKTLVICGMPVLFSPDVQRHIEVLINFRANFVPPSNLYLFAKRAINGCKLLNKYITLSGTKNPAAITCARLRKHIAAQTQLFSMSKDDMEQLTSFLGIHELSYAEDVHQTAKISKIILLMETGAANEFRGKSLDEIDVDLKEDLLLSTQAEDSDNEDLEEVNKKGSKKKRDKRKETKRVLIPWTEEQKSVVAKFFAANIKNRRSARRAECELLISQHPKLLENKNWHKIKVFVKNIYAKRKLTN